MDDKIFFRDAFHAAEHNDIEAIEEFIDNGVSPKALTPDNETIAHCAAKRCHVLTLRHLLAKYPDLQNAKDIFGNTVLHLATLCNSLDMVKYLVIEQDMDIYDPASLHLGNGPVHMAAQEGNLEILKFFIEVKNVDVNLRNRMGQPLVFIAALNRELDVVRYLLEERNADMFLTDDNKDTILHISSTIGDLKIPIYLLEEKQLKFDVNARDRHGETILHQAARRNHLVFVKYFVGERDADFNAEDAIGRTPLHEAAEQGNLDVVRYLMDQGASIYMKDNFGKTPVQVALDKHVRQYLEQFVPPERKRRSAPEFLSIPLKLNSDTTERTNLIGVDKSELPSHPASSNLQNFLWLSGTWIKYVRKSSHWSALSPSESIRDRIDKNAIDAVDTFSSLEN